MRSKTTRRNLIAIIGLSLAGGSLLGGGGLISYLLFDYFTNPRATASPDPAPPRPTVSLESTDQIIPPRIINRDDWGALQPDHNAANESGFYSLENVEGWRVYQGDLRDIYRTVVVHHSVLYEADDLSTVREIQSRHMTERGWADIGYHYLVGKDGTIYAGRDLAVRGTHVEHFNTGSVGVVLLGNFEEDFPTVIQLESTRRLINWLAASLELTHLAGHNDFNDTTKCPGTHLMPYQETLANSAGLQVGIEGYIPPPEQRITPSPTT